MKPSEHLIVTGATGFIGRHLLLQMSRQTPARITLLVRGESVEVARERVLSCVRQAAEDLGQSFDDAWAARAIDVWVGDLTAPLCGLDKEWLGEVARADQVEFWHVAATLCFEESKAQQIHDQNVMGTQRAVELAQALGATRFVYVSTAYVCGSATGEIPEAMACVSGPFNNAYERSKCLAEHVVRDSCLSSGLDYRILRPSIVVGLSESYSASGSETGLYGFVREAQRLRRAFANVSQPVRILAERDAPLNFIPVDTLVTSMLDLRRDGFVGGPLYHLSSQRCPTVGQTLDAVCDALDMPRFALVSRLDGEVTALEALLARRTSFYASYLMGTKRFARAQGPQLALQVGDVEQFVRRFLEARVSEPLKERWLRARDGFPVLTAAKIHGERETVVLVNALGMPRKALAKLEQALLPHYNVLTWESRGAPSLRGNLDREGARFARHVDDLEDILRLYGIERAHLVGWCTGADVAVAFAQRSAARVCSLVCLNGAFMGFSLVRTAYQDNLQKIVRYAAKSPAHAATYHALIGELLAGSSASPAFQCAERQATSAALSALDPEMSAITSVPLRSPVSFYRYCLLLEQYLDEAPRQLPGADVRALLMSAEDDAIAHVEASRRVATRLGAELDLSPQSGHFAPCKSYVMAQKVLAFIAMKQASGAAAAASKRVVRQSPLTLNTTNERCLANGRAA